MNPKDFQEKIKEYAEQYQGWKKPIDEFRKKFREEHHIDWSDHEGSKKLDLAVQEFTEEHLAQNPDPTEIIYSFLNQEYEAYFNAKWEECDAIRAAFSINREFEDLLLSYVYKATDELHSTKDIKWLERGLVAASLENSGRDYRDTYASLDKLYRAAKDVGIDPNPYFQKAALLASQEKPRGGSTPLSVLLDNYVKKPEKQIETKVRETKQVREKKNDPISILKRLFKSDRK